MQREPPSSVGAAAVRRTNGPSKCRPAEPDSDSDAEPRPDEAARSWLLLEPTSSSCRAGDNTCHPKQVDINITPAVDEPDAESALIASRLWRTDVRASNTWNASDTMRRSGSPALGSILPDCSGQLIPGEVVNDKDKFSVALKEFNSPLPGVLLLSNYHVLFLPWKEADQSEQVPLPLWLIERCDLQLDASVTLSTKNLRVLSFSFFHGTESASRFVRHLADAISAHPFALANVEDLPAGATPPTSLPRPGWDLYDCETEFFSRQALDATRWRTTLINDEYSMCASYPRRFVVPRAVTDQVLTGAARFRSSGRLPALSWCHPRNLASVCRSSQPLVGLGGQRSDDDETLVRAIRDANPSAAPLYIIDCRPWTSAVANRAKGAGTENTEYYGECRLEFMNIDNIHTMRDSLKQVVEVLLDRTNRSESRWLSSLEQSRWLDHLRLLLGTASRVAHLVERDSASVLVHCSDGWDRTTQIVALAQLLLDPYYRTIDGFMLLIEKEWLRFGFRFSDRCGHGRTMFGAEASPVFLQWCDCVWQLVQQFQCAFEFTEQLLILLMDNVYSGRFGTFLYNCERERERAQLSLCTPSIWDFIRSRKAQLRNYVYRSEPGVLFPVASAIHLSVWRGYYLRFHAKTEQIRKHERHRDSLYAALTAKDIELASLRRGIEEQFVERMRLEQELSRARGENDDLKRKLKCTLFREEGAGRTRVVARLEPENSSDEVYNQFCADLKQLRIIDDYTGPSRPSSAPLPSSHGKEGGADVDSIRSSVTAPTSSPSRPRYTASESELSADVDDWHVISSSPAPENTALVPPVKTATGGACNDSSEEALASALAVAAHTPLRSGASTGFDDSIIMMQVDHRAAPDGLVRGGISVPPVRFPVRVADYLQLAARYLHEYGLVIGE